MGGARLQFFIIEQSFYYISLPEHMRQELYLLILIDFSLRRSFGMIIMGGDKEIWDESNLIMDD